MWSLLSFWLNKLQFWKWISWWSIPKLPANQEPWDIQRLYCDRVQTVDITNNRLTVGIDCYFSFDDNFLLLTVDESRGKRLLKGIAILLKSSEIEDVNLIGTILRSSSGRKNVVTVGTLVLSKGAVGIKN